MFKEFPRIVKNMDYKLFFTVIALTVIGMLVVASATYSYENQLKYILVQFSATIIGIIGALVIMSINYEYFGEKSKLIFGINIFLLVLVLVTGLGQEIGGKSWMRFGDYLGIQPSELVKIGFIITFAYHVSRVQDSLNRFPILLGVLVHAGIMICLVLLQPDYGTAMVYMFITCSVLFVAGLRYRFFSMAIGLLAAVTPLLWFFVLKPYQKDRFMIFFNPEYDPADKGYQVIQSKIAIGSGGFFGKGLFKGPQTQLDYLPAKHTDFIFAVIGEEMGFIGAMFVLFLLFFLIYRCIRIGLKAKCDFGNYMCIGVAALLLFHVFENVGMCIGVMPITGIPLPFISYGGSFMMVNMLLVGLVMNVHIRRKTINF